MSIGNWPTHVVNGAIYTLPYDVLKDFEPVARLSSNPYVIVGRKDLPAADLKELIAWLKANPDKATEGTAGPGSGQHVGGVYFQNVTGTKFQFVPYRAGSSDILRDLVAGHIDLTFDQAITALAHVKTGQSQGLRRHLEHARRRRARDSDRRRGRRARRLHLDLERHLGAQGHAARRHRQADQGRDGCARRSRGARVASPGSARTFRRPSSRPRRRWPRITRPRSKSGGR